jgi:hypothetical protein
MTPPKNANSPDDVDEYVPNAGSFSGRLSDALKDSGGTSSAPTDADASPEVADAPPLAGEGEQAAPEHWASATGGGEYIVRQGECISSIAENAGHFWETLWGDPQNAQLREARKFPNILLPGDRVHVPPLRPRWESGQAEMRHRFQRKGWPEVFRMRILRDDEPRGNQPYTLAIDGKETSGVTDADGNLSAPIEPNAKQAVMYVGTAPDVERYDFSLGAIDPIDTISGVQGRLNNLGFDCGAIDGKWGPRTEAALRRFQRRRDLNETGQADEPTRQKLREDYGS